MIRLLIIEWKIWSKSPIFRWGLALWFVASLVFLCLIFSIKNSQNWFGGLLIDAFQFPIVFNTIAVLELLPAQILCFLLMAIICQDIDFQTYRMHLLSGQTGKDLWLSKTLVLVLLSLMATVFSLLLAWLTGLYFGGVFKVYPLRWLLVFYVQFVGYGCYAILFALLFKKLSVAAVFYAVWFLLIERFLAHVLSSSFYFIDLLLPGKALEELSYLIVTETFFTRTVISYEFRLIATFLWITLAMVLSLRLYKSRKY